MSKGILRSARYKFLKLPKYKKWGTAVSQWLTLNPLTWKIWRAPNNASIWQMGFNSAFKGLRYCATYRKVAGSIPAGVSGYFIDIKSFRSHYGPGVDSASNRNKYQDYFLGVKAAGA